MNKLEQAARQALEALENAPIEYDFHGNPMDVEFGQQLYKAITALREALDHIAASGKMVLDDPHPPHRLCECTACLEYWTPKPTCDQFAGGGKTITLTEEQAQQIEEAFDELRYANNTDIAKTKYYKALSTIRAARAQEQAEQEPVAFEVGGWYKQQNGKWVQFVEVANAGNSNESMCCKNGIHRYTKRDFGRVTGTAHDYSYPHNTPPLYAAPVQQVDLTDYEIASIGSELAAKNCVSDIAFARAVIAKFKEKNK